ncbi:hypothetical protein E2C01_068402 [Portunus trituberculatus]|uniref:Uncharacterized protein n=1 Tax=Portunus trituberculatus TaxID=210409 RepID=A0A5B7HXS2_PORTR|nr:hypothetical protein [Portunus trituberculatus]
MSSGKSPMGSECITFPASPLAWAGRESWRQRLGGGAAAEGGVTCSMHCHVSSIPLTASHNSTLSLPPSTSPDNIISPPLTSALHFSPSITPSPSSLRSITLLLLHSIFFLLSSNHPHNTSHLH